MLCPRLSFSAAHSRLAVVTGAALAALAAVPARAQEPPADKSGYTLFNPTPRGLMREMSTDRPDTTESAFTVDAGHFQVELSFIDYNYDRRSHDHTTTRAYTVAPMLLKVGLLNNVDLQLGLDPYTRERSEDRTNGDGANASGFGDTQVRLKINFWGNDDFEKPGDTALAIMPFVKFPTAAEGLGNGDVEGGIILPFALQLPADLSLGAMAELDFNRSAADDRTVVDFVHTVTLGYPIATDLDGYVEYAGFANLSHDERYRGYFDAGVTYALNQRPPPRRRPARRPHHGLRRPGPLRRHLLPVLMGLRKLCGSRRALADRADTGVDARRRREGDGDPLCRRRFDHRADASPFAGCRVHERRGMWVAPLQTAARGRGSSRQESVGQGREENREHHDWGEPFAAPSP